jgi:hypothetical protein
LTRYLSYLILRAWLRFWLLRQDPVMCWIMAFSVALFLILILSIALTVVTGPPVPAGPLVHVPQSGLRGGR